MFKQKTPGQSNSEERDLIVSTGSAEQYIDNKKVAHHTLQKTDGRTTEEQKPRTSEAIILALRNRSGQLLRALNAS